MSDMIPEMVEMYTLLALGVSAVGLGLPGVFARRREGKGIAGWRHALMTALLLGLLGAAAAGAGLPRFAWLPPLALALVWLTFALLRTGWPAAVTGLVARLLAQPGFQAAAVVLAGVSLLAWQTHALTANVEDALTESDMLLATIAHIPALEVNLGLSALTDAGQSVPLWRVSDTAEVKDLSLETFYLHNRGFDAKVIRTGPVDLSHNCHGWVFTGGKGWVRGAHVEQILRENRYEVVSSPAAGDLAIYRDVAGIVSHTALVRAVTDDGVLLLESKWGKLGRFIHTSTEHVYTADSCTYYRSSRGSHVLRLRADL